MALLSTAHSSLFFSSSSKTPNSATAIHHPKTHIPASFLSLPKTLKQSLTSHPLQFTSRFSSLLRRSSAASEESESDGVTDEWGEKPEPKSESPKAAAVDPPVNEDEWEEGYSAAAVGNGNTAPTKVDDATEALKRSLADTVYGTDLGFRAGSEVRAEVSELVSQLEAVNPTPAPVDAAPLLDGNWVLLYTSTSELLPLLAAGSTPLLKVKRIAQLINTSNNTIVNSTTLSSPFADFSFSATANFEVRSPSRIQVEFKEGTLQPPDVKTSIDLPDEIDLFGQKISLSPALQSLGPLQDSVATISRAISGQSPLKVPIPGSRTRSWLLTTYLDEDLRISRGDGGLFILAKEGSPLLNL
ncbi:unnamed protein product [Linum tenue]|uniref:Plastid lipid-associated protein/fibrillin conserved domain-containing protein n=1 Tax=Linum tenue TaxID=586396 RepID=A0AAV0PJ90_9ROSI|nr:unnamed protein product [Linum tenue]